MQDGVSDNVSVQNEPINPEQNIQIVQTDIGADDGQNKCPKCGSTDISTNINSGKLRCHFCRHEFEPEKIIGLEEDLSKLQGQVIGSGVQDIIASTEDLLTFKCSSCGSEVVIDTSEVTQARCHWCRNTLSVNQQIPNGSVPDVILPFSVTKADAKLEIEKFVNKRKFFASPIFKKEFTTENIMGVYFPYMVVDVNSHSNLSGQGEHLVNKYTRGRGENQRTYYDADLYQVEREFDLVIDGLTIESSSDKLNNKSSDKTNNIINSIMPFDIDNCVKWDANFIRGYTSEKRDTNIEQLKPLVEAQSKDIARFAINSTLADYDRGVAWSSEQLSIIGQQWKAAYLPVWLYSYQQVKGNKKLLHYVAVNARTKETMGSVPIHMPKLVGISSIIEFIGLLFWWVIFIDWDYGWTLIFSGIIFFTIYYAKYRNSSARHTYEKETKSQISNVRKVDTFVQKKTGLTNSRMSGANNTSITGQKADNNIINSIIDKNQIASFIREQASKNS